MAEPGRIRCGIGGWTYEPWRGVFYPPKLSQKKVPLISIAVS